MERPDTVPYPETALMRAQDLHNRWIGATEEEIAFHNNNGELQALEYYKGPIKGIIWCKPVRLVWTRERQELKYWPDYFLIMDILKCEKENPEYIGNIDPNAYMFPTGVEKQEILNPLHDGLQTYSAYEVMNMLELTPIELIDILNGVRTRIDEDIVEDKRLITTDEEAFRNYSFTDDYFTTNSLRMVSVYKKDLNNFCKKWEYEIKTQPDIANIEELNHKIKVLEFQKKLIREENSKKLSEKEELILKLQEQIASFRHEQVKDETEEENANERRRDTAVACGEILIEIGNGNKRDYMSNDFFELVRQRYSDYHTETVRWAWRMLPPMFKKGAGRAKKAPENPTNPTK